MLAGVGVAGMIGGRVGRCVLCVAAVVVAASVMSTSVGNGIYVERTVSSCSVWNVITVVLQIIPFLTRHKTCSLAR